MPKEHMDSIDNRSLGEAAAFAERHKKILPKIREALIEDLVDFSMTSNDR